MIDAVPFTGRICLTDYTNGKGVQKIFNTSAEQDSLIRQAAERIAPPETLRVMTEDQIKVFHALLENITGGKITRVNNEKGFYHTDNNITYADRFIRPWAGIHVDVLY